MGSAQVKLQTVLTSDESLHVTLREHTLGRPRRQHVRNCDRQFLLSLTSKKHAENSARRAQREISRVVTRAESTLGKRCPTAEPSGSWFAINLRFSLSYCLFKQITRRVSCPCSPYVPAVPGKVPKKSPTQSVHCAPSIRPFHRRLSLLLRVTCRPQFEYSNGLEFFTKHWRDVGACRAIVGRT